MLYRAIFMMCVLTISGWAEDRGLSELASSLASQIKSHVKGAVAVTSFVDTRGGPYCQAFNRYLVDRLDILLVKGNSDFAVVTRDRVEEIFKETNLALAKNYDASTFAKVGHQLGAHALIRGSYTIQQQGATISIAAQLLDVETGRIVGGDVVEIPLSADIRTLLESQMCAELNSGQSHIGANNATRSISPETPRRNAPPSTVQRSSSDEVPIQSSSQIQSSGTSAIVTRIRSMNSLTAVTFKIDNSMAGKQAWIRQPSQFPFGIYTNKTLIIDNNGRRYRLVNDHPDVPEQVSRYEMNVYTLEPHEIAYVTYLFEKLDPAARSFDVHFISMNTDGDFPDQTPIHVALQ